MSAGGSPLGPFAVIWSPVRTLRRVAEERRAFPGFVVVALYAALGLIVSTTLALTGATRRRIEQQPQQPGLPPGFEDALVRATEIGTPIFALLSPFLIWISVSLFMQLTTGFFGGAGPLPSMFGVVGVAQAPFFISGALSVVLTALQLLASVGTQAGVVLGYVSGLTGFVFLLWYVVLVVIGAALARGIGYGESAGSCALSCAGLGVLIILAVILAVIGIFATVNAAAP